MTCPNISNIFINEDFFDEISTDEIINSDVETNQPKTNYNHNIKIHTSDIETANSPKDIQLLLNNYIKKLSIVLNIIKSVEDFSKPRFCIFNTKQQKINFFGMEDIPEMYENSIFRSTTTVMIYVDIQCNFKNIHNLDKFLHSILISIQSCYKGLYRKRLCSS